MENLDKIPWIRHRLKTSATSAIVALHKFIFQEEGDRLSRKRLRAFRGFQFRDGSAEYIAKRAFANSLPFSDLVSCCDILGLDCQGTREELIQRICNGLMNLNALAENREDKCEDKVEDEDDDARSAKTNDDETVSSHCCSNSNADEDAAQSPAVNCRRQLTMHYHDIEDSIRTFDGKDAYPVEKWIAEFESAAVMYDWSELEKVTFGRKSLTGLAKLCVQSEGIVRTWERLKSILLAEFAGATSSAQLHYMLTTRKMKSHETAQEYYLVMKELASRGDIEEDVLIQYIINGIQDDTINKTVLFGAKRLSDFRERLKVYEMIRQENLDKDRRCRCMIRRLPIDCNNLALGKTCVKSFGSSLSSVAKIRERKHRCECCQSIQTL